MSATNNVDDIMAICAACGKEGIKESMNICNKCKMVHYCNFACKKKHKSKHKKKCEKHAAKLHDEALFQEPPPREECPICFLFLPLKSSESQFKSCCGKIVCHGCSYRMIMDEIQRGKQRENDLCPYCRESPYCSEEVLIKRLKKLMENGNGDAFNMLGLCYADGSNGVPRDEAKKNELFLKAGELGCADGYFNLGCSYHNGTGVEMDKGKAKYFYELAAMSGKVSARNNLGIMENNAGNHQRAMKHLILAASAGHDKALEDVKKGFMTDLVTKDEYESTLRAYYERQLEMKSEAREKIADILAQRQPFN